MQVRTHARTHTHRHTHTHTFLFLFVLTIPPVWFDPVEATVAVGSNITVTCRSNQWATLVMANKISRLLVRSVGTSVVLHLVHVQEVDTGVIYCLGSVGNVHQIAEFYLTVRTVCKLHWCDVWVLCYRVVIALKDNLMAHHAVHTYTFYHNCAVRHLDSKPRFLPSSMLIFQYNYFSMQIVGLAAINLLPKAVCTYITKVSISVTRNTSISFFP